MVKLFVSEVHASFQYLRKDCVFLAGVKDVSDVNLGHLAVSKVSALQFV